MRQIKFSFVGAYHFHIRSLTVDISRRARLYLIHRIEKWRLLPSHVFYREIPVLLEIQSPDCIYVELADNLRVMKNSLIVRGKMSYHLYRR